MVGKDSLKTGQYYKVDGKGNDIFKNGEMVLFVEHEGLSYTFKQGTVEIVINEPGIDKFLSDMNFTAG